MKTSSDFHTGGVLLLTATVICGALAVTVITPLLQRESFANTKTTPAKKPENAEAKKAEKFAEFFPSIEEARQELKRFHSVAGPLPQPVAQKNRPQMQPQSQPKLDSYFVSTPPIPNRSTFGSMPRQPQPQVQRNTQPLTSTPLLREPAEPQTTQTFAPRPAKTAETATATAEAGRAVAPQATTIEPVVTAGQLISPSQLPSGSVYAPVTVNIDSSAISQQMKEFTERFEELIVQKNQQVSANEAVQPQRQIARKRPRNRQPRNVESRIPDEQIVRIEAGLQELTKSLHSLRDETQSELRELARQTDRGDMATKLLESYERSINERIRQVTDASASVPVPPTKVAIAPKTTYSDAVPFPAEPAPQPSREFRVEPTEQSKKERDTQQHPVELSKPIQTIPEKHGKELSFTAPDSNIPTLPTIVREAATLSVPRETVPVIVNDFEIHSEERSQTVKQSVPIVIDERSFEPDESQADDAPLELFAPVLLNSESREPEAMNPLELTPPAAQLSPVPSRKIVELTPPERAVPVVRTVPSRPVGFENVYRFKLANVESNPVVVPGDGPVCKKCGKVHGPGELHQQPRQPAYMHPPVGSRKLVQTSAKRESETTGSKPAINEVTPPTTTPHNRNAARGSNRHVRKSRENDSEKPVWDAELPSLNGESDSPGLLHRLGSTIKQFGR